MTAGPWQVNEMLSDVTSTGSAGAFDRMKEKVGSTWGADAGCWLVGGWS